MEWTEADFQDLLKYVIAEPTQKGYGEQECGGLNPSAAYALLLEGASGSGNRVTANAAWLDAGYQGGFMGTDATAARVRAGVTVPDISLVAEAGVGAPTGTDEKCLSPVRLALLIEYLEAEIKDKELRRRAIAWHDSLQRDELVRGAQGLVGQEALDVYVSELVARLRDFPYNHLEDGGEVGMWVRDVLLAPSFRGRWDFYENQKVDMGFDLPSLVHILCGRNQILDRLRYAKVYTGN